MTPIKIHIYNKNGDIINTYIFIGNVENSIRKALELAANNKLDKQNSKRLKDFYGKNWQSILNINTYRGGLDNTNNIDVDVDVVDVVDAVDVVDVVDVVVDVVDNIGETGETGDIEEEISLEELNAIINIEEDEKLNQEISQKKDKVDMNKTNDKQISYKKQKNIYVFDVNLYPHDNILEFKKKISLVTKIPIYKQHIWYNHTNKNFNFHYTLFVKNKAVNISLLNTVIHNYEKNPKNIIEYIDTIPILIDFYNIKKLLSIKCYETFSIIEEFTNKLNIMDFNLISMDEYVNTSIFNKLKNNELEIIYYGFIILFWPMMSLSVWLDYAHNPDTFEKIYPDLGLNLETNKQIFNLQDSITDEAQELFEKQSKYKKERDDIIKNLYLGITYSSIQVLSTYTNYVLNLRNLFDKLELSNQIISCKCSALHDGKKIIINKTFKDNNKISQSIPLRCIVIRIKTNINYLDFYIYPDGNYTIKSKWPEEELLDFEKISNFIKKYVNPVIDKINTYGKFVIRDNNKLEHITQKNSKFSEVFISLIYRKPIRFYEFQIIENILKEYSKAHIIESNETENQNMLEYYFLKGMYKFDGARLDKNFVINNYYSFLTDAVIKSKWKQLFVYSKKFGIQYRHGDIKITIDSIKEAEFDVFYMYIINIIHKMYSHKKQYLPSEIKVSKHKKNVKTLKQSDPILYDFKKLYNSPIVYSKICQKPYQPVILNNDEFNELNDKDKKRVVKYWNFTTNSEAKYYCPNQKYPYIQFTIKKHPKDYCLPCCKIKPITKNDNKIKQIIYDSCISDHKYQKEKTNIITETRYVMNYGKYITPGRICNLPENSIEPLFYENFSESNKGSEPECEEQNRYYLYGIEQNIGDIKNVGFISSLAFSLDMNVSELITNIITLVKKDPSKFSILLDGKIYKYFWSYEELLNTLHNHFFQKLHEKEVPWNDIFIDIAYNYLNLITIMFIDKSHDYENIKLVINSHIKTPDKIINPDYKVLIFIKKKKVYNPIYLLNSIVYFRTKLISKKIYESYDNIVNILKKVIIFTNINQFKNSGKKAPITLFVINSFIKSIQNKSYEITSYFINNNNQCYYLEIKTKNSYFYFPITYSSYSVSGNINIIYDCYTHAKYNTSLKLLNGFIKTLNHWIAVESAEKGNIIPDIKKHLPIEQRVNPIYAYISIEKWLLLSNPFEKKNSEEVIGFTHNGINYYHEHIKKEHAIKLSKVSKFEQLLYHPDDINISMYNNDKAVLDNRSQNIAKDIYNYYIYELLLLEFTELLNKERNSELRYIIKKEILHNLDNNSITAINNITKYINDYYEKIKEDNNSLSQEDHMRITNSLNKYMIKHRDKKLLIAQIDNAFYNFDQILINNLKTMPKIKILQELIKMSKKIVTIVSEKKLNKVLKNYEEFPNMLISCQDKQSNSILYCKNKKLQITADKLKELLEIMTMDILNPFKQKWLFNIVFTKQIINYFRFVKRPDEIITIEVQ